MSQDTTGDLPSGGIPFQEKPNFYKKEVIRLAGEQREILELVAGYPTTGQIAPEVFLARVPAYNFINAYNHNIVGKKSPNPIPDLPSLYYIGCSQRNDALKFRDNINNYNETSVMYAGEMAEQLISRFFPEVKPFSPLGYFTVLYRFDETGNSHKEMSIDFRDSSSSKKATVKTLRKISEIEPGEFELLGMVYKTLKEKLKDPIPQEN